MLEQLKQIYKYNNCQSQLKKDELKLRTNARTLASFRRRSGAADVMPLRPVPAGPGPHDPGGEVRYPLEKAHRTILSSCNPKSGAKLARQPRVKRGAALVEPGEGDAGAVVAVFGFDRIQRRDA